VVWVLKLFLFYILLIFIILCNTTEKSHLKATSLIILTVYLLLLWGILTL